MKKLLGYGMIGIGLFAAAGSAFLLTHAPLGKSPDKERQEAFGQLANYENGEFVNESDSEVNISLSEGLSMLRETLFSNDPEREPEGELEVEALDWEKINSGEDSLVWFGHSTYLLTVGGKRLFLDPMLGPRASPLSFVGGSERYSADWLGIIPELPEIDAVLLTHDHYDHLDFASIEALESKVGHFFVPLGVGEHLVRWGVERSRITELNWWEEAQLGALTLALTPANHFSGRGLFNRNSTLWGGWAVFGEGLRFYASGDGGYGGHFREIGERYGPFDLTLMEGGQYDTRWESSHMTPEQAVQAFQDVQGETMMLAHWAAFTLAFHAWDEPVERALSEAGREDVRLITPKIGETLELQELGAYSSRRWWEQ